MIKSLNEEVIGGSSDTTGFEEKILCDTINAMTMTMMTNCPWQIVKLHEFRCSKWETVAAVSITGNVQKERNNGNTMYW